MNIKEIQNLIKFVYKSGVEEVKIEKEDFKITIKTKKNISQQIIVDEMPSNVTVPISKNPSESLEPISDNVIENQNIQLDNEKHVIIKSPIIGTFYRKPSPDKDSFVEVGQTVEAGNVLCVIEAMKLFNEIESEISGTIIKILADDQSPVEFDQPLFIIDPS
ncbi:MAG: Biotin carboxyl carrier protein of acetyl-CoA carboxylase [Flavobacteriales bacterium]|nr:MAG: Biotin carboxyl carrier protein of acetyl-CoA carboxylase [Flavobacteriales bacterium]|tara:strand:- start:334 stop:819 length:486 start_codon:yes stop_codon:yes gene_type:complete